MKYLTVLLFLSSVIWGQALPTCQSNAASGKTVTLTDFTLQEPGDPVFFFVTSLAGKNATTSIWDNGIGGSQNYVQVGGSTFYVSAITGDAAEFTIQNSTSALQGATITSTWTGAPPTAILGCEMNGITTSGAVAVGSVGESARTMQSGAVALATGSYLVTYCVGGGATMLTGFSTPTPGFSLIGSTVHSGCVAGWATGPGIVSVEMDYSPNFILHASGILTVYSVAQN